MIRDYRTDRAFRTITAAAREVGVTPGAVRNWIARGYIDHLGHRRKLRVYTVDGARYVLLADAYRAEGATLDRGRPRTTRRAA